MLKQAIQQRILCVILLLANPMMQRVEIALRPMYAHMRANDHKCGHHNQKRWRRHSRTMWEKRGPWEGELRSPGRIFTSCMEKMRNCISCKRYYPTCSFGSGTLELPT